MYVPKQYTGYMQGLLKPVAKYSVKFNSKNIYIHIAIPFVELHRAFYKLS
jgi:hypothetical protein